MPVSQRQPKPGQVIPFRSHPSTQTVTQQLKIDKRHNGYHAYLDSLSPTGRKAMTALLKQATRLLDYQGDPESFAWHQLDFAQVQSVRSLLLELEYSTNTINTLLSALKGVAKTAFQLGHMNSDTLLRLQQVKVVRGNSSRNARSLSHLDVRELLQACESHRHITRQRRDSCILMLGINAGLRAAELCALNLNDIDLRTGKIVVRKGKGRKRRELYVSPSTLTHLKQWLRHRHYSEGDQETPLFVPLTKNGGLMEKRLSQRGLGYLVKVLHQKARVEPFTPHDLRRTFITQLLEQGTDLNLVRQLAGHNDISTTVRYDKRNHQWLKHASQNLRIGS
jgi:integrase